MLWGKVIEQQLMSFTIVLLLIKIVILLILHTKKDLKLLCTTT